MYMHVGYSCPMPLLRLSPLHVSPRWVGPVTDAGSKLWKLSGFIVDGSGETEDGVCTDGAVHIGTVMSMVWAGDSV